MKEMERYSRQISIPGIGKDGQQKLRDAKVLIIGAGGLGSPVALYLTAAGVGTIGLIDYDCVSESNLNRQVLYEEKNLGQLKVKAAAACNLSVACRMMGNPELAAQWLDWAAEMGSLPEMPILRAQLKAATAR